MTQDKDMIDARALVSVEDFVKTFVSTFKVDAPGDEELSIGFWHLPSIPGARNDAPIVRIGIPGIDTFIIQAHLHGYVVHDVPTALRSKWGNWTKPLTLLELANFLQDVYSQKPAGTT